jgi:BON domain-containing protein
VAQILLQSNAVRVDLIPQTRTTKQVNSEEDAMNRNNWLLRVPVVCLALVLALAVGACSSTQTVGTQVDDAAITAAVKAKLAADGDINPFNIDVDTNEGVVTLQGRVEKAEARTKAEQLARETDGVKRVINLVKVGDRS